MRGFITGLPVFTNNKQARRLSLACCLLVGSVAASTAANAAPLLIDDFTTAQSGTSSIQGGGILGGERDIVANGSAEAVIGSGMANMSLPAGENSNFVIADYDGQDGSAGAPAFLLGDVDLTDGGTNKGLELDVISVTGTVSLTIRISLDVSTAVEQTLVIDAPGPFLVPFSSFPGDTSVVETVNRLVFRFELDAGEEITIGSMVSSSLPFFKDGFED